MPNDDRDQPVKRKRATQECDPPGIAGRVCDGLSRRRRKPSASCPHRQFGAFPHASKNSTIGARRTLACAGDPKLHFTLNHYNNGLTGELVETVRRRTVLELWHRAGSQISTKTVRTVLLQTYGPRYPTQVGTLTSVRQIVYLHSGRTDSNRQRSAWKADALPLSYARKRGFALLKRDVLLYLSHDRRCNTGRDRSVLYPELRRGQGATTYPKAQVHGVAKARLTCRLPRPSDGYPRSA